MLFRFPHIHELKRDGGSAVVHADLHGLLAFRTGHHTMPELLPIPEQAPIALSGRASELAQQIEQVITILCTGT